MWSAHRAVLLGSIPARRLHPSGEEFGLEAQGLHPAHPPALTRGTHRRRLVGCWSRCGVRRHRRCGAHRLLEQHPAPLELRLAAPVREQPIMTETLEAGGQDMEQEAPDELDGIEGHEPVTVAMGIVFPPKGHPTVLERQQATIRDRYAMGIAREILQHWPRATNRRLRIHHPFCGPKGIQELLPPRVLSEGVASPLQRQSACRVRLLEPGQEQTTEHPTQDTDREEEGRSTGSPLGPIG
jgi:hypothetical protein